MVLSVLCAVHCVVTPLLLLAAPFVASHEFEEHMRLLLGGLAIVAVGAGTLTHRSWRAVPFLLAGLSLLVGVQLLGSHGSAELAFSLLAAASLIAAHVINTLSCRRHKAVH
jgi:hypothetical protein